MIFHTINQSRSYEYCYLNKCISYFRKLPVDMSSYGVIDINGVIVLFKLKFGYI